MAGAISHGGGFVIQDAIINKLCASNHCQIELQPLNATALTTVQRDYSPETGQTHGRGQWAT